MNYDRVAFADVGQKSFELRALGVFTAALSVGVAFVSLRDNLDLSTPSGRLMFQIIGVMAEFERVLIQERVKAGLTVARSKGKTLGRPRIKRERDRDTKRIRQLRGEGQSYREIADELGRSTMDVYRVAMTLGCAGAGT